MPPREYYLRDVPRACIHLNEHERSNLCEYLESFSSINERPAATNQLYFPKQQAERLREKLLDSEDWVEFDNRELYVAAHATNHAERFRSDFTDRFLSPAAPIQRVDDAAHPTGYRGPGWDEARQAALDRDDHECVYCGADDDLHVHHIVPYKRHNTPEAANRLENLETTCSRCHPKAESGSIDET